MPDSLYRQMTAFLLDIGINDQPHTGKTYIGHLLAVYRLMEEQGCGVDACRAGLFHSVYGTEVFQKFKLQLERREEVRSVNGRNVLRISTAPWTGNPLTQHSNGPKHRIRFETGFQAMRSCSVKKTSTICAGFTSTTGWNKCLGRRGVSNIDEPLTVGWQNGSVRMR